MWKKEILGESDAVEGAAECALLRLPEMRALPSHSSADHPVSSIRGCRAVTREQVKAIRACSFTDERKELKGDSRSKGGSPTLLNEQTLLATLYEFTSQLLVGYGGVAQKS